LPFQESFAVFLYIVVHSSV